MIPTHSHKSKHYFSNICQTKVYTIEPLHIKFTLSLIFIIALLTGFNITAKTTMADDSIFNSDKKSLSIDTPHMKLTQSVKLKKGIIYSDILNQSAINFYYINNPSSNYILYIKCIDENISPNYIQFFDSSYNELAYYPQPKSSYLYIDMNSILSGTSETKRIYVTIGNASASNDKLVNRNNRKTLQLTTLSIVKIKRKKAHHVNPKMEIKLRNQKKSNIRRKSVLLLLLLIINLKKALLPKSAGKQSKQQLLNIILKRQKKSLGYAMFRFQTIMFP